MPANFESGMFVREPAWHGMGVVVDDYPESWEKARELAGLEWEPVSAPNFGFTGTTPRRTWTTSSCRCYSCHPSWSGHGRR